MNITLRTNALNPSLTFGAFRKFPDGSAFTTVIAVRSDWLMAEREFICDVAPLERFLKQLEALDRTLKGTAMLKPEYEHPFIELSGNGQGHIVVRGELIEQGDHDQTVRFCFRTDQTCIRPLIEDLRTALAAAT